MNFDWNPDGASGSKAKFKMFMIKNKIDKRNKTPQDTHTLINVKFKDNPTIYNYILFIIISKSVQ